ncbi:hypothetical protein CP8484711_1653A, partial [Chlamydia psittaci 84-8471/1]
MGNPSFLFNL